MLAEMGIALREDCSVVGVFTPKKVWQLAHASQQRLYVLVAYPRFIVTYMGVDSVRVRRSGPSQ